ncbi:MULTISPECIES: ACT domain-containing protein [unclassified Microbacterium]|jgi:glycine cleavage system regulatory protein|uniref:glycine cleavage system protein R n=1 Tax=unclassified Microbacterium TaxID=2609290 RepID=UPI00300F9993
MTTLVLTVVGDDRVGLVAAVADVVDDHGGNWENSQLAELAGAFAGIIEVSVAPERATELREALAVLDGLLEVTVHPGSAEPPAGAARLLHLKVIGNDHPGIVRDISAVLHRHDVSIDRLTTTTTDAAMYGGRLFEASVVARVPASVDLDALTAELERLAAEIQVDVTLEP